MRKFFFISMMVLTHCSDPEMQSTRSSTNEVRSVDSGSEVYRTTADKTGDATIFIPDSSSIAANSIQIEDCATIANQATASYLNFPGQVVGTGNSINVVLANSHYHEQVGSLIITLPLPPNPSGLSLTQKDIGFSDLVLSVFYHVYSA